MALIAISFPNLRVFYCHCTNARHQYPSHPITTLKASLYKLAQLYRFPIVFHINKE